MKLTIVILALLGMSCTHKHSAADKYMHQHKTHKELILSFDDPKRDEWQNPSLVFQLLGPLGGKQVLDIGAGSGYFAKKFYNEGAIVTAGDVDAVFLEHLKKNAPELKLRKLDVDDPKMGPGEFDVAFTSNTYHHIDHRVEYLKKIRLGLAPKGALVVLDFRKDAQMSFGPPPSMRVAVDVVIKEMVEAGFSVIQVYHDKFLYQYLIVAKKD